jgi:hypothetical protein
MVARVTGAATATAVAALIVPVNRGAFTVAKIT